MLRKETIVLIQRLVWGEAFRMKWELSIPSIQITKSSQCKNRQFSSQSRRRISTNIARTFFACDFWIFELLIRGYCHPHTHNIILIIRKLVKPEKNHSKNDVDVSNWVQIFRTLQTQIKSGSLGIKHTHCCIFVFVCIKFKYGISNILLCKMVTLGLIYVERLCNH